MIRNTSGELSIGPLSLWCPLRHRDGGTCKSGDTGGIRVFLAQWVRPWELTPPPVHMRLRCPENVTVCLCKATHLSQGQETSKGHGKSLSSGHEWFCRENTTVHFRDSTFLWLATVPLAGQKCFCGPINVSNEVRVKYNRTDSLCFRGIWSFHLTLQTKG